MSCPFHGDVWCTCPDPVSVPSVKFRSGGIFHPPTKQAKHPYWLAVFGAFVAAQAHKKLESGQGTPSDDDMDRFVAEAETVATLAVEAVERSSRA